jgi:hypothetical protein
MGEKEYSRSALSKIIIKQFKKLKRIQKELTAIEESLNKIREIENSLKAKGFIVPVDLSLKQELQTIIKICNASLKRYRKK